MPDYKTMYLKLLRAAEQAANLLVAALLECEESAASLPEAESTAISLPEQDKKGAREKRSSSRASSRVKNRRSAYSNFSN